MYPPQLSRTRKRLSAVQNGVIVDEHHVPLSVVMLEKEPTIKGYFLDVSFELMGIDYCFPSCRSHSIILSLTSSEMIFFQPHLAPSQSIATSPGASHDQRIRMLELVPAEICFVSIQHLRGRCINLIRAMLVVRLELRDGMSGAPTQLRSDKDASELVI